VRQAGQGGLRAGRGNGKRPAQQAVDAVHRRGRSNCIQTAQIGGRPSYVELLICLKATQIAPTLPDAR
jgi:hypothetical protein